MVLDQDAGHLHPLNYASGLARAAQAAGAILHERTAVLRVTADQNGATVETTTGTVRARYAVIACNGYLGALAPRLAHRIMPIN